MFKDAGNQPGVTSVADADLYSDGILVCDTVNSDRYAQLSNLDLRKGGILYNNMQYNSSTRQIQISISPWAIMLLYLLTTNLTRPTSTS